FLRNVSLAVQHRSDRVDQLVGGAPFEDIAVRTSIERTYCAVDARGRGEDDDLCRLILPGNFSDCLKGVARHVQIHDQNVGLAAVRYFERVGNALACANDGEPLVVAKNSRQTREQQRMVVNERDARAGHRTPLYAYLPVAP